MANYFTLNELKQNLNIELDYTNDDIYLTGLTSVACQAVDNFTNYGLTGYTGNTIPISVKQAAIMLASHLYLNRTPVSFAQGYEIPYSFQFLLNPYKNFVAN